MEPMAALRLVESNMRLVIRTVFPQGCWIDQQGAPGRAALEASRRRDVVRRDGVVLSDDLLDFAETKQLTAFIDSNWTSFRAVFKDEERTHVYFALVNRVRYAAAHNRNLVPFEEDLLSGVAGHLRQLIGEWRDEDDPSTRFYPRIERVADYFGTEGSTLNWRPPGRRVRLQVGDQLSFAGSAYGRQNRSPHWWVDKPGRHLPFAHEQDTPDTVAGASVAVTYVVQEGDVGEALDLAVYVAAPGKYQRHAEGSVRYDDIRYFRYAVDPPEEPGAARLDQL